MSADVVVVGCGVVGACVALEAARAGARVTLLERGAEPAWECSAGNAGIVAPGHSAPIASPANLREGLGYLLDRESPFALRPHARLAPWLVRFAAAATAEGSRRGAARLRALAEAGLALHREYARDYGTGLEQRGVLEVYETEQALAAAPGERLDAAAVRELEPALGPALAGGVLEPDAAHVEPRGFVHAVARAAAEAGAELRFRVEALGLRRDGRRVVLDTSTGELRAAEVVLAAGAWTARLARDAGLRVPLEGGKGYHVDVEAGPAPPRIPLMGHESRVIATPFAGRLRFAGTLELAGLDLSVDRRRVAAVQRAGERLVPSARGARVLEVWRGLRPCAPDGLPIVGRPEGLDGLVLATGHAMKGLALAPATARLVARLLAGEEPRELAGLGPDRFRRFAVRGAPAPLDSA